MTMKIVRILELLRTPGAIFALFKWPIFSLAAYHLVSRAKLAGVHPKSVVDIGANIGQFSIASLNLFHGIDVYSVEPNPGAAVLLKKNLGEGLTSNIHVVAVGSSIGSVEFNLNHDSQVSSVLPLGEDRIQFFPNSTVEKTIMVPMTTLDNLFGSSDLKLPILLKIDVQGLEDQVISGGKFFLSSVRWIVIEVSFADLYKGERDFMSIVELLARTGFKFVRPLNFHTSPKTGEIIEMDALFESNV